MLFWVILNLVISGFLIVSVRKFVLTFYLIVNYLVFVQPMVIKLLFGAVHPQHDYLNIETYETALIYVAMFNIILGASFLFFEKTIPVSMRLRRYFFTNRIDHHSRYGNIFIASIALLSITIIAKSTLDGLGAFRMLNSVTPTAFLQLFKLFGTFDLFLLIFIGEIKEKSVRDKKKFKILYIGVAAVAIGYAVLSGSRSQVIVCLLIMMISHRAYIKNHLVLFVGAVSAALPTVFIIFPLLALYRNNGYNFNEALDDLTFYLLDTPSVVLDILTTRLNYIEAFVKAYDYVDSVGPAGGAVYWNNLIGLVPRLFWPGKPQISNDSQVLGHALGIVTADDTTTSIGLRVIGEAYYELAWLGLIVAIFQGLMFAILQRQAGYSSSAVLYTIYIYTTIYLMSRDGFIAVVPGLVYLFIGWFIFFGIITYFTPRARGYGSLKSGGLGG